MTSKHVVFIHGLFMNPKSWDSWKAYFEARGYTCHTPAFPYHEGNPEELRKNPDARLARVTFRDVINTLVKFIDQLPEKPILIGHSVGALAVQKLINLDKGAAGICINSAPPLFIFTTTWSFVTTNMPVVNPFKGNSIFYPTVDWFHRAFCNTLTMAETEKEFNQFVVPESRNIPRSITGPQGSIDFKKPHVPLLLTSGDRDTIVPADLNRKNHRAYAGSPGITDYVSFQGRSHYICGQPGWEEVADYCLSWLQKVMR